VPSFHKQTVVPSYPSSQGGSQNISLVIAFSLLFTLLI